MSDITPTPTAETAAEMLPGGMDALRDKWYWLLALGIALMVLGLLAIGAAPLVTDIWVTLFGILLLLGGAIQVVQSFSARAWRGFLWHVAAGGLYLIVGGMLVAHPLIGAAAVTIILAVAFLVDGVLKVLLAMRLRDHPRWGWLMFDGIVLVALAVMIIAQWPGASTFIIGLLIGIQMLFAGASFTALALSARESGQ